MSEINSTCPYCGVGCGVSAQIPAISKNLDQAQLQPVIKDVPPLILGSKVHPANFGRLCSKGSSLSETLLSVRQANRLTQPKVAGQVVSWDSATTSVAKAITDSIEKHGKESVAFYLSGQLLTEDYYVANKLMKGYVGTANVDTNSRLCMSSAVAAYKRAFGADVVPCSYEDLEYADLIVLVGSNAAWTHPVLYQRMLAAKETNPNLKVVLIDPRKTASFDLVDIHLPLAPSSDGFLFQGLLKYLNQTESIDVEYIESHTDGFSEAIDQVQMMDIDYVSQRTKLKESDVLKFYQLFAQTKKTVSFYSQGINQSATGTDKCNAIINCHLATGKLGYAGAGPFSITGQPNAMGGREVGGLANQLAAHMDFSPDDIDRVQRFWNSPDIATQPGLKAVDLFDALEAGEIKVLWIMATNPAVSLPNSTKVREALKKCPTVIVSDVTHTDTTEFADILLPAQSWGEKDGTVTNSERRISRQRKFIESPGLAKADWWALSQVAIKLGHAEAFAYKSARDIFVEHAKLSGFENSSDLRLRAFDVSGLSELTDDQYDCLAPTQWPINTNAPLGSVRMFEDGLFFTNNGKAQFISGPAKIADIEISDDYPLVLNTGRLRDQWHTMTRTGLSVTLTGHDTVPFIQVHTEDASKYCLSHNSFAQVSSSYGSYIGRVEICDSINRGQLFSPIHWTDKFAQKGIVNAVVSPTIDPISGQPEFKASAVNISSFDCEQWVRVVTEQPLDIGDFDYWSCVKISGGYLTLLGLNQEVDWQRWALELYGKESKQVYFANPLSGQQCLLISSDNKVQLLLYANSNSAELPSDIWLSQTFNNVTVQQLSTLIVGEPDGPDKLICACFGITNKNIQVAASNGSTTIESLGSDLGCGSKCGSCKPEISQILKQVN